MGHERVGTLPRTRQWRQLVDALAASAGAPVVVPALANETLTRVRSRLDGVADDPGFAACFQFLVLLARGEIRPSTRLADEGAPREAQSYNAQLLETVGALQEWVAPHQSSLEYADLGVRAAADAIAYWVDRHHGQEELFGDSRSYAQLWADANNGAAFSEISRAFFARFIDHYLQYFLGREASGVLPSDDARSRFDGALSSHADALARHAFESTKIAQSFAAGWYNKHVKGGRPTEKAVRGFLAHAIGKLREELRRESA